MTTTLQLGGEIGSRLTLPLVAPSIYAAPQFAPPQPSQQRSDIQSAGFPWPGDWKTERDEINAQLEEIYRNAPRTDSKAYAAAQKALKTQEELFFSDVELDHLLPKQLRAKP